MASVYAGVATSTFDTTAYLYIKQFEDTRNGHEVMLALKLKFGGEGVHCFAFQGCECHRLNGSVQWSHSPVYV
jgi:hypothetical protein